jgi:transcriptional regulator of acetoin/glycerol metabolism
MDPSTDQELDSAEKIWSSPMVPKSPMLQQAPAGALTVDRMALIRKSHQRCAAYGLNENVAPDLSLVGSVDLSRQIEQNRTLYTYALPVIDTLYEQIVNTHSMVLLTDPNGLILHTRGDDDFLEKADKVAMKPGASWSEQSKGTNAVGTAIAEKEPTLVHSSEHYLNVNHILTCSAAPIFDPHGSVVGVIDVTGDYRSYHKHTMALVRMSAQMIENQLFSAAFDNAITLHFHSRPELVGTLMEGIASFTPGGRFLSANRTGLFKLGLPLAALQSHTFSSLFGLPVSALFDHHRSAAPGFLTLNLHTGVRVFARAELRLEKHLFHGAVDLAPENESPAAGSLARRRGMSRIAEPGSAPQRSSLDRLDTGDPQIARAIGKVGKVLGHDIPVLLIGETGTGKDLFAQAVHRDSPQAHGPFVAVNCASIPETLIESELFGYEDGAFTGARKSGSIGKILQANGGSLFLDEIGDMPLNMQAHLLRVLQERRVTPLGSTKSIPVDFALICATNRNLRDLITGGTFREDLYYRINGLVLKMPPLRERTDLEAVVGNLLAAESNGIRYTVAPDIMQLFRQHRWPGNIRQLKNVLRTAMVMADDDHEIRREHLSEDFLEDIGPAPRIDAPKIAQRPDGSSAKLEDLEVSAIRQALERHRGNVSATARELGISRNTIYRKLQG